jgi:hypothetical protein
MIRAIINRLRYGRPATPYEIVRLRTLCWMVEYTDEEAGGAEDVVRGNPIMAPMAIRLGLIQIDDDSCNPCIVLTKRGRAFMAGELLP